MRIVIERDSNVAVRRILRWFSRGKTRFLPRNVGGASWESAFPATTRVIARERTHIGAVHAVYRDMRIVSSRHEPLVKNIRSGFKGERKRKNEKGRESMNYRGEWKRERNRKRRRWAHTHVQKEARAHALLQAVLQCSFTFLAGWAGESHRVRPFDFLFCLEGAHQRVSAGERESRGLFSGKIFALVFKRGSLVTGAETSGVYKLWVYHAQK